MSGIDDLNSQSKINRRNKDKLNQRLVAQVQKRGLKASLSDPNNRNSLASDITKSSRYTISTRQSQKSASTTFSGITSTTGTTTATLSSHKESTYSEESSTSSSETDSGLSHRKRYLVDSKHCTPSVHKKTFLWSASILNNSNLSNNLDVNSSKLVDNAENFKQQKERDRQLAIRKRINEKKLLLRSIASNSENYNYSATSNIRSKSIGGVTARNQLQNQNSAFVRDKSSFNLADSNLFLRTKELDTSSGCDSPGQSSPENLQKPRKAKGLKLEHQTTSASSIESYNSNYSDEFFKPVAVTNHNNINRNKNNKSKKSPIYSDSSFESEYSNQSFSDNNKNSDELEPYSSETELDHESELDLEKSHLPLSQLNSTSYSSATAAQSQNSFAVRSNYQRLSRRGQFSVVKFKNQQQAIRKKSLEFSDSSPSQFLNQFNKNENLRINSITSEISNLSQSSRYRRRTVDCDYQNRENGNQKPEEDEIIIKAPDSPNSQASSFNCTSISGFIERHNSLSRNSLIDRQINYNFERTISGSSNNSSIFSKTFLHRKKSLIGGDNYSLFNAPISLPRVNSIGENSEVSSSVPSSNGSLLRDSIIARKMSKNREKIPTSRQSSDKSATSSFVNSIRNRFSTKNYQRNNGNEVVLIGSRKINDANKTGHSPLTQSLSAGAKIHGLSLHKPTIQAPHHSTLNQYNSIKSNQSDQDDDNNNLPIALMSPSVKKSILKKTRSNSPIPVPNLSIYSANYSAKNEVEFDSVSFQIEDGRQICSPIVSDRSSNSSSRIRSKSIDAVKAIMTPFSELRNLSESNNNNRSGRIYEKQPDSLAHKSRGKSYHCEMSSKTGKLVEKPPAHRVKSLTSNIPMGLKHQVQHRDRSVNKNGHRLLTKTHSANVENIAQPPSNFTTEKTTNCNNSSNKSVFKRVFKKSKYKNYLNDEHLEEQANSLRGSMKNLAALQNTSSYGGSNNDLRSNLSSQVCLSPKNIQETNLPTGGGRIRFISMDEGQNRNSKIYPRAKNQRRNNKSMKNLEPYLHSAMGDIGIRLTDESEDYGKRNDIRRLQELSNYNFAGNRRSRSFDDLLKGSMENLFGGGLERGKSVGALNQGHLEEIHGQCRYQGTGLFSFLFISSLLSFFLYVFIQFTTIFFYLQGPVSPL